MTVIRPNSISGINSITANGGDINLFRADGTKADVIVNNITGVAVTFTNISSTNVSAGSSVTAVTLHGSGANLTTLNADNISSGLIPSARISQGSVTQYVTPFDDDKIINDISALALKVSALENSTASNTNSTFVDTYQDSAGISTITDAARSTTGEFVASVFDTVVTYQFDQAGTHGQPGILRMNSGMGAPVTGYWAEERTAETGGYIQASVNFAFDLSGDFTHYFYHKVNGSGQATSVAYPNAGAIISPKTTITTGKNPTYNGSTIWDIDLSANQAEASGGSFSPDQIEDQIFTSAVETHLGISNLPGGNQATGTTQVNINYASVANANGYHFGKYMNSGSARHGVKYTYTKSNNTMLAEFTQNDVGAVHSHGKVTITNLPTAGRVFLFYGNANGGGSSSQYIGMKTDASGVGVSNGSFTTLTSSATGSYQSTTINAAATTSKMGVVVTYVDQSGTTTLNTDLKVFLSANNGTNYTQVTLVAQPNFATGVKMAKANDVTISNTGTQLKYKVEFANQALGSKETRVTGVSLQY